MLKLKAKYAPIMIQSNIVSVTISPCSHKVRCTITQIPLGGNGGSGCFRSASHLTLASKPRIPLGLLPPTQARSSIDSTRRQCLRPTPAGSPIDSTRRQCLRRTPAGSPIDSTRRQCLRRTPAGSPIDSTRRQCLRRTPEGSPVDSTRRLCLGRTPEGSPIDSTRAQHELDLRRPSFHSLDTCSDLEFRLYRLRQQADRISDCDTQHRSNQHIPGPGDWSKQLDCDHRPER